MTARIRVSPISIIVAVDQQGGFGKNGKIPWDFSEDMKHFREVTKGGVCIMGRKTYEDMLEMTNNRKKARISPKNKKAIGEYETNQKLSGNTEETKEITDILPGRQSFVVTSNESFNAPGATVVSSLHEAVQSLDERDVREVFVIGGQRMFIEALSWTTVVHMTVIKGDYDCDVFFPVKSLDTKFMITEGTQTDDMYFMKYQRTTW